MTIKSSAKHSAGIALLHELEAKYGSVDKVPDDNPQLVEIRKMLDIPHDQKSFEVPNIVIRDDRRNPIYIPDKYKLYEQPYRKMLKDNLTIEQACKTYGVNYQAMSRFLFKFEAKSIFYQMTYKNRKLRGRTIQNVMNEAKKLSYRSTSKNAIENHDLHRRIILAPLIFKEPTALKSR